MSCTRDYCDESIVKTQIDAIEREGLRDIGWKYATLDDCWGGQRQPNGSYHWDQNRFPSGIPHLAEYAHSKGLLFGLYLGAGNETCSSGGKAQKVPGSLGHYAQDALTLASWGVDYIKLDWCGYGEDGTRNLCGANVSEPDCKQTRFRQFSEAMNATGRHMYLSASSVIGTPGGGELRACVCVSVCVRVRGVSV